jgi:1-acyl-sn-glycerol-3-phosphate acyltransferase
VAVKTNVPIVPVGIGGSERVMPKGARIPRPRKMHMIVGEPILPPVGADGRVSRHAVKELSEQLHEELQRLFDAAQLRAGA